MKKQSDHLILQQVLKGDVAAFSKLIALHESMLFTLALGIMKNRQDAEEVTQDAFVKAYQSLAQFKGESAVSTWLYKIVYHTAISALRSRRQETIDLKEAGKIVADLTTTSPIERMASLDRKKALKQALLTLEEDDAFLVILFYYKEHSIQEIAEITALTESNVKVKLHRARKQLQQTLQSTFNEELESIRS